MRNSNNQEFIYSNAGPLLIASFKRIGVLSADAITDIESGRRKMLDIYKNWEKALFRRLPWAMKLHRASIYLRYESQALAFTKFKGLMKLAVGRPFNKLLAQDVADPVHCKTDPWSIT